MDLGGTLKHIQEQLKKQILNARDAYSIGTPIMTDEDYDNLYDYFVANFDDDEIKDTIWKDENSSFEKAEHLMLMGSQEKITTEQQMDDWIRLKRIKFPVLAQLKLDGISIELQYEEGKLNKAITRGNGVIGDSILANVSKMKFVPLMLLEKKTCAIRGEIMLSKKIFNAVYKPKGYSNPRNMAAGISKQKTGAGCENLMIIVYDIEDKEKSFKTETDKMKFLDLNEFNTADYEVIKDKKVLLEGLTKIEKEKDSLEIEIDGVVIKQDAVDYEDRNRLKPDKQRAWKFKSPESMTRIIGVEWSFSGHYVTPVALLEPVHIAGSTVARASLANTDEIKRLNLRIGDIVVVSKRNEIIPKIERVYDSSGGFKEIEPITKCIHCGSKLFNDGKRMYCEKLSCPGRMYHRITKWIKKLDVQGFGPALLDDLFEKKFVLSPLNFYTMDLEEYIITTNLEKATRKAFNNLYSKKELPLETIIAGYDIEGIGEKIIKILIDSGYNTLEKLTNLTKEDIERIDGFGQDRAKKFIEGFLFVKNEIVELIDNDYISVKESSSGNLKNISFCFTGKMINKRNELEKMVINNGGIVRGTVSKNLSYLVNNDSESESAKNKSAIKNGVKIITEKHFLEMIGG